MSVAMRRLGLVALALSFGIAVADAAPKIGVAAAVKNDVSRLRGAQTQPLVLGADLFTQERIRTGADSAAQILFLDKTALTIGPGAELTLDRFVYDPSKSVGRVAINAVKGAFRFVTGVQSPRNYTINTPVGTIGVRGTVIDLVLADGNVTVILVEGSLSMTVGGQTFSLTRPGTAYVISAKGGVSGPVSWDGAILAAGGDVSVPLHGWRFRGEQLNLPGDDIARMDQIRELSEPIVHGHHGYYQGYGHPPYGSD